MQNTHLECLLASIELCRGLRTQRSCTKCNAPSVLIRFIRPIPEALDTHACNAGSTIETVIIPLVWEVDQKSRLALCVPNRLVPQVLDTHPCNAGSTIETVIIPVVREVGQKSRLTLCVSTQVCGMCTPPLVQTRVLAAAVTIP